MKSILVIGLGRFGKYVCRQLDELNQEVMAIDSEEQRIQDVLPYVKSAQIGDSTDEHFLQTLGIRDFDVCIVAIGDDFQDSLVTTSLLKELGAKCVVSRAANDIHAKFLMKNGADDVIYPERQLAIQTAIRYSSERIFDYTKLDTDAVMLEVSVPKAWVGKTVLQVDVRKRYQINIAGIRRDTGINPDILPDYKFTGEERILVIGKTKNIDKCFDFNLK